MTLKTFVTKIALIDDKIEMSKRFTNQSRLVLQPVRLDKLHTTQIQQYLQHPKCKYVFLIQFEYLSLHSKYYSFSTT